jgi:hypothetical protein
VSERTDRYEEHVAYVVGKAREVASLWVAEQIVGEVRTVTMLELALMELHHAIGVLDMDGIEPDDE